MITLSLTPQRERLTALSETSAFERHWRRSNPNTNCLAQLAANGRVEKGTHV